MTNLHTINPGTYTFSLWARDDRGWSGVFRRSFTVNARVPAAPTNLRSDNVTHNSLTFRWNAAARATSYTVYRYNNGWRNIGSTTGTSFNITGLNPNTRYWFAVRAWNTGGTSGLRITNLNQEVLSLRSVRTMPVGGRQPFGFQ